MLSRNTPECIHLGGSQLDLVADDDNETECFAFYESNATVFLMGNRTSDVLCILPT